MIKCTERSHVCKVCAAPFNIVGWNNFPSSITVTAENANFPLDTLCMTRDIDSSFFHRLLHQIIFLMRVCLLNGVKRLMNECQCCCFPGSSDVDTPPLTPSSLFQSLTNTARAALHLCFDTQIDSSLRRNQTWLEPELLMMQAPKTFNGCIQQTGKLFDSPLPSHVSHRPHPPPPLRDSVQFITTHAASIRGYVKSPS